MYASFTSAVVSASCTCCVASRRIIHFIDDMTPLSASVSPRTECLCACVVGTVYSGSIQLTGGLSIITDVLHASLQFNVTSQSFIDFTTDVDFYDGVVMCLRMGRPDFHVRSTNYYYFFFFYDV